MAQRRLLSRLAHDEMDAGSFDLVALRRTLGEGSVGAARVRPVQDRARRRARRARLLRQRDRHRRCRHAHRDRRRPGRAATAAWSGAAAETRPAQQEVAAILGAPRRAAPRRRARRRRPAAPRDARAHPGGRARRSRRRRTTRGRDWIPGSRRPCARSSRRRPRSSSSTSCTRTSSCGSRCTCRICSTGREEQAWSRNPLTRSLKSTYPMIFEVAVFIASRLQRAARHPAAGRRDRLHRHARRRAPRAQPPGRPAADRDDRVPGLLRPARAAALERRPLARPGDRGRRRRDARRPGLGVDRHRPRAHDDRPAVAGGADREDPAVPHRRRRRARAGGGRADPPRAAPRAAAHRARALLRAVRVRARAGRRRAARRRVIRRLGVDARRATA